MTQNRPQMIKVKMLIQKMLKERGVDSLDRAQTKTSKRSYDVTSTRFPIFGILGNLNTDQTHN